MAIKGPIGQTFPVGGLFMCTFPGGDSVGPRGAPLWGSETVFGAHSWDNYKGSPMLEHWTARTRSG